MKLNFLSSLKFNKNVIIAKQKEEKLKLKNQTTQTVFVAYPKTYYLNQVSFGAKNLTANELIKSIEEENFPSPKIVKKLKDIGNSCDYSLYDIHLAYYKDLLDCSTLDEAKEKYPEFKDVIDVKDVDYKKVGKRSFLYQILTGKMDGIDIDTLSLELLKRLYGKAQCIYKKECYFGISEKALRVIFDGLNINLFSTKYVRILGNTSPQSKEKKSKKCLNMLQHQNLKNKKDNKC